MALQKLRNTKIQHCQTMGVTSIVLQMGEKKYNVFQDYLIGTKEKLGIRFRSRIYFISSFFKLVEDMN